MKEGPQKTNKKITEEKRGSSSEASIVRDGTCGEVTLSAGKNRLTLQVWFQPQLIVLLEQTKKKEKHSESAAKTGNKRPKCACLNYAAYMRKWKCRHQRTKKNNTLDWGPPPTASVNRISLSMLIHLSFCSFFCLLFKAIGSTWDVFCRLYVLKCVCWGEGVDVCLLNNSPALSIRNPLQFPGCCCVTHFLQNILFYLCRLEL